MRRKFLTISGLILFLFCSCDLILAGTTGKIAGRVLDKSTRETLPGVNVVIKGTTMGAATNLEGYFAILNIPPGIYSVTATMMGYKTETKTEVKVSADLTSEVNFLLEPTVIEIAKEIVVTAERPLIEKGQTQTMRILESDAMKAQPYGSVTQAVALQAGAVMREGTLYIRGGRSTEVVYYFDGMLIIDPVTNTIDTQTPFVSVQESEVYTGGFGAEYGSAQSGVVNVVTKEGGRSFSGLGVFRNTISGNEKDVDENQQRFDFGLGGPEPLTSYLLPLLGVKVPGQGVSFYLSGQAERSDGKYIPYRDFRVRKYLTNTYQAKLTYRLSPNLKLNL